MCSASVSSCLLLFVMSSNTYLFDTVSPVNNSSEPKMASSAFMESPFNQSYPNFPDSVQFTSQGDAENLFFGSPTQLHHAFNPFQDPSADLNDLISLYDLGYESDDLLGAPAHQSEISQMPPLALENFLEVSCLGTEDNSKEAKDRKKNVKTKGGIINGSGENANIRRKWSKEEDRYIHFAVLSTFSFHFFVFYVFILHRSFLSVFWGVWMCTL